MTVNKKRKKSTLIHSWFIAHKHNQYRPHILRIQGISLALVMILLIQLAYNLSVSSTAKVLSYAASISNGEIVSLTNAQRTANGLAPLASNGALNAAAAAKAADMFANNYWAHVSPSGVQPWHFINQAGYSYVYAGENLAKDFSTSGGVVNGWMASGPHAQNILNPNYRDIGVAVVNGTLQGSQTTLVVAFYAAPRSAPPPPPAPASPPPAPPPQPVEEAVPGTPEPEPETEPEAELESESEPQYQLQLEATGQTLTNYTPPEVDYGVFRPMEIRGTLDWGRAGTTGILGLLATSSVLQHTVVWRQPGSRKKNIWFRGRPLLQAILLVAAIVFTIAGSFGSVH